MNTKLLIALADAIIKHNASVKSGHSQTAFDGELISTLADFCAAQNDAFKRDLWVNYIFGTCNARGGKIA